MTDIVVTAANVLEVAGATIEKVTFGATITQGMAIYLDTSDEKWKLGNCETSATTAGANGIGVALTSGADGQQGLAMRSGNVNLGATLVVGTEYYVSTAGGIMPVGDKASNDYVTLLGIATTASNLRMTPIVTGIQVP